MPRDIGFELMRSCQYFNMVNFGNLSNREIGVSLEIQNDIAEWPCKCVGSLNSSLFFELNPRDANSDQQDKSGASNSQKPLLNSSERNTEDVHIAIKFLVLFLWLMIFYSLGRSSKFYKHDNDNK